MNKEVWDIVGNEKLTGSVKKETIAVSDAIKKSVQNRHSQILLQDTQQNVKNASRTKSLGGRSPSVKMTRLPCKDYLKGTCRTPFCEKWHPSECLFYKSENGSKFEEKCSYAHRQVDEQPSKKFNKKGDKIAVTILKKYTTIGLRISGYGVAEVFIDFAEGLKHTEANPMCSIHQSRVTSRQHSRPKNIAWNNLPR